MGTRIGLTVRAASIVVAVCILSAARVEAVPSTPTNVVATTVSSSQVSVGWSAVATAVSYDVYRSTSGGAYAKAGSTTSTIFSDIALASDTTFEYEVQAIDGGGTAGPLSNAALATTTVFTDDPLVSGTTPIKAVHITELRTAVNAVRAAAGLSASTFTDSDLAGIAVKSVHMTELRDALNAALSVLAMPSLVPANPATAGTIVNAADVSELRSHVSGLTSTQPAPVSFCARGPASQVFSPTMQACAGAVPFASRGSLCGPAYHVCSATEWVANRGALTPAYIYWTNDPLRFGNGGTPNNCYVSLSTTNTSACSPGTEMLVCSSTTDAKGNTCAITGCGFNSTTPIQWFGGCSGSTAGTLCCHDPVWYVNAATGLDTNPGTAAAPFKTITYALGVASTGQVLVAPGTYSTANGETFPLIVTAGVALIGDEANSGAGATPTLISGCGISGSSSQAIVPGASSTIAGFTFTCTSGHGILLNASGVTIRNNTIAGNANNGVYVLNNSTNHVLTGNTISNNSGDGVLFGTSTAGGKLENNVITNNFFGVVYGTPGGDLGGGAAGSAGGNVIACNTNTDLWVGATIATLSATNNKWDHVPPTTSTTTWGSGVDIYAAGAVTTTGASLAPTICP